jgi:hypothetical protein
MQNKGKNTLQKGTYLENIVHYGKNWINRTNF